MVMVKVTADMNMVKYMTRILRHRLRAWLGGSMTVLLGNGMTFTDLSTRPQRSTRRQQSTRQHLSAMRSTLVVTSTYHLQTCVFSTNVYHVTGEIDWLTDWSLIINDKHFRQKPSLSACPCWNYNTHVQSIVMQTKWQKIQLKASNKFSYLNYYIRMV